MRQLDHAGKAIGKNRLWYAHRIAADDNLVAIGHAMAGRSFNMRAERAGDADMLCSKRYLVNLFF